MRQYHFAWLAVEVPFQGLLKRGYRVIHTGDRVRRALSQRRASGQSTFVSGEAERFTEKAPVEEAGKSFPINP